MHPAGRLLEVGASWGLFLEEAAQAGYACSGIELAQECAELVRAQLGIPVFCGTIEQYAATDPAPFDVIVMRHCLEHMADPKAALAIARSLLKPDGMLLVVVPNVRSLAARAFGRQWEWMVPPNHLYYFSSATLQALLAQARFSTVRSRTVRGDAMNFVHGAIAAGAKAAGVVKAGREQAQRAGRSVVTVDPSGRLNQVIRGSTEAFYFVLSPAFMLLERAGLGEQLEIFARPA